MATIASKQVDQFQGFSTLIQWGQGAQATADVGEAVYVGHLAFLSANLIVVSGTTPSVEIQGSVDGVNWGFLGTAAFTLTSNGQTRGIVDPPLFIRFANITGTTVVAQVSILGKRFS